MHAQLLITPESEADYLESLKAARVYNIAHRTIDIFGDGSTQLELTFDNIGLLMYFVSYVKQRLEE